MIETVSHLVRSNAGDREIAAIFRLLELMHAEVAIASMDRKKVKTMIGRCLDGGAVCIAMEDGKIVGTMGLLVTQFWYSDEWIVQEMWTFVHPDHRRSHHAKNLLMLAVGAGKQLGMPLVAGVTSTERTEGKCRLYRRHMTPFGAFFISNAHKDAR